MFLGYSLIKGSVQGWARPHNPGLPSDREALPTQAGHKTTITIM